MTTVFRARCSGINLLLDKIFSIRLRNRRSIMNQKFLKNLDEEAALVHHGNIAKVKLFIPPLTPDLHKGQCGRIGVVGGCAEYTGAPYFAAVSALKLGADLAFVFCCKEAGVVIKSYSPELIVLPILDDPNVIKKIESWLTHLHALIIGPGLGRETGLLKNVLGIINLCGKITPHLPLVFDADGLFLLSENLDILKNYKGPVILTPNAFEFNRLCAQFVNHEIVHVATSLNAIIIQKGLADKITNGICNKSLKFDSSEITISCKITGSSRRCGGQGDILSGCVATFAAWYDFYKSKNFDSSDVNTVKDKDNKEKLRWFRENVVGYSWACYGACAITKTSNWLAFEKHGRSMTASDMISSIHEAFELLFGM